MTNKILYVTKDKDVKNHHGKVQYSKTVPLKPLPKVSVQMDKGVRILLYIFYAILIYLFCQIFVPLLQFKIYIDWWHANGGKQYNNVFSIRQFAYYGNFRLYAIIGSLLSSGLTTIQNKSQYLFILSCMSTWGRYDETDENGFLLPIHICESIVVGEGYPTDTVGWKKKLETWGVPQDVTIANMNLNSELWEAEDNFLFHKYGIPQRSPFILSFQSGSAEGESHEVWYPTAFLIAVGINPTSQSQDSLYGGWWGFINTGLGTETASLGEIYRYLYGIESSQLPLNPTPPCSIWGDISTTLTTAATFAMAGAAFGPLGVVAGFAITGAGVGIGVGTAIGVAGAATKHGTKKCTGWKW
jgi:hypothetical protein